MMLPSDHGPLYVETDMSRFPVEPWNTFSNLVFLAALLLYARKTGLDYRRFPLLVLSLPILLVGFVGGTAYHASRSSNLWLYMDFIPIMLLAALAAFWFWRGVVQSRLLAAVLVLAPTPVVRGLRTVLGLPHYLGFSLGYITLALTVLVPACLFCRSRGWRGAGLLLGAALCFALAISFRISDAQRLLPMGTHFLWHLFGGFSSILLMEYLYRSAAERPSM